GVIVIALAFLLYRLPTGYLPDEDQGFLINFIALPPGTEQDKTMEVAHQLANYYTSAEKKNVEAVFTAAGFNPIVGMGQNAGVAFVKLKDWNDRPGAQNSATAVAGRAFVHFMGMPARDPLLLQVRPASLPDAQQLHIDIDQAKANALGVSTATINSTLSAAWGGQFVNNFIDRGRVKRVYLQGDAPYRMTPDDLSRWYVRTSNGAMAPFSSFARASWSVGPTTLTRYNGLPSIEIQGQGAAGISSGTALAEMDKLIKQLPQGVSYESTGLSYQEEQARAQAPALYALSILIIYLCLAALYESWAIPLSVMLVIPLGVIGAVGAVTLRGLFNDIYFQVGMLAIIGLSAKNAILIVEFAVDNEKQGMRARDAAMEAARIRLRPILMTSIAFIAGVSPLAV